MTTSRLTECWASYSLGHSDSSNPIQFTGVSRSRTNNWGDCLVCGDRGSGKHYGVLSCEGCKGFFKRSIRKKLIYTCRGSNDCVIDKIHRNRCQKCRFAKCIGAGMKREAVQMERKSLVKPETETPEPENGEDRCYDGESGSDLSGSHTLPLATHTPPLATHTLPLATHTLPLATHTPPLASTSIEPIPQQAAQETDILGPQHAEFRLNLPTLGIPRLSMDYVYEFATRLLFISVDWAQSICAFQTLHTVDQVSLLRKTWSEIFLLGVAQCIDNFPFSPLLAHACAVSDLKCKEVRKPPESSVFDQVLCIKEMVFSFEKLDLDSMEFAYLKAIVLFNSDPRASVQDEKQVDKLQEESHCALKSYIETKYSNNPERFAKILLRLPAIRLIDKSSVEELFFAPLIGTVKIGDIMEHILSKPSTQF